jgi:hypothetical protein
MAVLVLLKLRGEALSPSSMRLQHPQQERLPAAEVIAQPLSIAVPEQFLSRAAPHRPLDQPPHDER